MLSEFSHARISLTPPNFQLVYLKTIIFPQGLPGIKGEKGQPGRDGPPVRSLRIFSLLNIIFISQFNRGWTNYVKFYVFFTKWNQMKRTHRVSNELKWKLCWQNMCYLFHCYSFCLSWETYSYEVNVTLPIIMYFVNCSLLDFLHIPSSKLKSTVR